MSTVAVCTNLYPLGSTRTRSSETRAVRDLVETCVGLGYTKPEVVRFLPFLSRLGVRFPKHHLASALDVYDVPRVGIREFYSAWLTNLEMSRSGYRRVPDLAICHMLSQFSTAQRMSNFARARKVLVLHGSDIKNPRVKVAARDADTVLARSEAISMRLAEKLDVVVDGVVFSGTSVPVEPRNCGERPQVIKMVIASVLIPLKNVDSVIGAVAALVSDGLEVKLDIFGDGPLRPALERMVDKLSLRTAVHFHGFVDRGIVLSAMRSAHLFVMPSAPETFGLAFLEAMACGCVVIGHQGWGIDGPVKDKINGYLVEEPSARAVAERVWHYAKGDRQRMHDSAAAVAMAHTSERAAVNYAELTGWAALH